ncbi:MAG: hypothetical protein IJ523_07155 [Succinivibrionaceae bacterium]|nr:hypothetical protein [Succinivibrionaceae bacterium]
MTREEAVSLLRRYRRDETYIPSKKLFGWKLNYEFMRSVYERMLILELIQRIKQSDRGPMTVVRDFYYKMDDILCESENPKTWAFASTMENCAADIVRYMEEEFIREKRRKRRDAKN